MKFVPAIEIDSQEKAKIDQLIENGITYKDMDTYPQEWISAYDNIKNKITDINKIFSNERRKMNQILTLIIDVFAKKTRNTPTTKYIYKLILQKQAYNQWSSDTKELFDQKCEIIYEWNYLFFSYTNRACANGYSGGNTNFDFETFLTKNRTLTKNQMKEEINHLAATVFDQVNPNGNTKYFFDQKSLKSGNKTLKQIQKQCEKSLHFIQLIEPEVFIVKENNETNWTLEEFLYFNDSSQKIDILPKYDKYHFVITSQKKENICTKEDLPKDCSRTFDYEQWYDHYVKTVPTSLYSISDIKNNDDSKSMHKRMIKTNWKKVSDKLKDISRTIINNHRTIIEHLKIN